MVKVFSHLPFFILIFTLYSCATGGRGERAEFHSLIEKADYQEAFSYIEKTKFYQEPKNVLLKFLEQGLLLHRQHKYPESIQSLEKAKDIIRELYTVSISKKAETLLANDNADIFYGEAYEHALVYFYLSLNHILMAQNFSAGSSERVQALHRARAELLSWDSMLKTLQADRQGKSVYKNDLLAKIYGGLVHEMIGTREDKQIALVLFKNAKEVLLKNANAYKAFNKKSLNFKKDFEKLPSLKNEELQKNYIEATLEQENLIQFINLKIKQFEKKEDLGQIIFVVEEGLIPLKNAETQYYGLTSALQNPNSSEGSKVLAQVGHTALTFFALNKLKLLPPPANWSPIGAYLGVSSASLAADSLNISFELPIIKNDSNGCELNLNLDHLDKNIVFPLISPLGDIAEEAVAENSSARYLKIGARLASKHIAAILSSYGTYTLLSKNNDSDFLATNMAIMQYAGLARAIAASEKADTRQWSSLPQNIFVYALPLKAGKHHPKIKIKKKSGSGEEIIDLGPLTLEKNNSVLVNIKI